MDGKRDVSRRSAIVGGAAVGAEFLVPGSLEAKTKKKVQEKTQPEPAEQPERIESPGEMDARLLDEYARFLKTQSKTLEQGNPRDIIRLLSGIPQIWDPAKYKEEDRKLVYGPFSPFLEARDSKNLPVIPFKNQASALYWNLTKVTKHEAISSARMEYAAKQDVGALKAIEQGVDVVIRRMESFGEFDSIPTISLTAHKDADLHCTRAAVVGLAYTHKEAQDREEREPIFVSGVLLSQAGGEALSKLIGELYAAKGSGERQQEVLKRVARGAMIFVPALGHEGTSVLGRTDSAVGAPLANAAGELVGILSDVVETSYFEQDEKVSKRVFLVQGPDNIRRLKKAHPEAK